MAHFNPFKYVFFWAFILYAIYLIAFLLPMPGIYFMFFWPFIGLLAGLLPHIALFSLIGDVCLKRLPKIFLIIPVLFYGIYYTNYIQEYLYLQNFQQKIKTENPSFLKVFDTNNDALILGESSGSIFSKYKTPVIYKREPGSFYEYLSYRPVEEADCAALADVGAVNKSAWDGLGFEQQLCTRIMNHNFYIFSRLEKINKNIIEVNVTDTRDTLYKKQKMMGYDISGFSRIAPEITTYKIYENGKLLGEFKKVTATPLPKFPFFLAGCALNSGAPSWDCFATFKRTKYEPDIYPETADVKKYGNDPVAFLLQIPKTDSFHEFPENKALVEEIVSAKKNENPEEFNKWGLKKDSWLASKMGTTKSGYPYFQGYVSNNEIGLAFDEFVKEHLGKTVYIDAKFDSTLFLNYVDRQDWTYLVLNGQNCIKKDICKSYPVDSVYSFPTNTNSYYEVFGEGKKAAVKGFWKIEPDTEDCKTTTWQGKPIIVSCKSHHGGEETTRYKFTGLTYK